MVEVAPIIASQASSATPRLSSAYATTTERFVVFLDIMGFKDRVARNLHGDVLRQLEGFQNSISKYVHQCESSDIKVSLFSDSVLLFSSDDSTDSLRSISEVTRKIMRSALQSDVPIPLKGAIARGTVTCDVAKQLCFGQALIDAYVLEENVKYYGVLVHHTAEKAVSQLGENIFRDVSAYLRCGRVSHYELNWHCADEDPECQKMVEQCLGRLRLTVSDEPRKYIDNTLVICANDHRVPLREPERMDHERH